MGASRWLAVSVCALLWAGGPARGQSEKGEEAQGTGHKAQASVESLRWPVVSSVDEAYLRGVAGETWACIAHFVEPSTGLPLDTSERGEFSSATNLGYYVACCTVAARMGLVSETEAAGRVERVLDSYERFTRWKGFSQSWNNVRTLEPAGHDRMVSLLDSANMVAGFVVAGQALPQVRGQVERVVGAMDFAAFYDPQRGLLFGGYDMGKQQFAEGWYIGDYAGDGRMAAFWAIASQAAPPSSWENLGRATQERFGLTVYRPAWEGGGLFMQVQDGLFLDERATPAGKSAANYAYVQMLEAHEAKLPVWGWSACYSPDERYLGWGGLERKVVTPHAAGMAAMWYPHQAAECLRAFERLGAREPLASGDGTARFGFRDSVDLEDGAVCKLYVPALDQAMMFLGIANALEDRLVQRLFESHPTVQRGRQLIAEYRVPVDRAWIEEVRRRDAEGATAKRPAR